MLRVRLKPSRAARYPNGFRRLGRMWTPQWQEIDDLQLRPEALELLTGPASRGDFDVEEMPPDTPTPKPRAPTVPRRTSRR